MLKSDVVSILREMADLLEITEANTFEVMAHRNAAQALEDWQGDLAEAISDSTLTQIQSIGDGIAGTISDLVSTGDSPDLNRVRSLVPADLPKLLKLRGLGPKRVRALWKELSIEGPDDLKKAAEDGRVQSLKGFGAKTVERILQSLEYFQNESPRTNRVVEATSVSVPRATAGSGQLQAGTSGYSYEQWKGNFYPADASTDDLLQHYAHRLQTVEINNTFYRFPSEKVIAQWVAQTPAEFRFAVKAHRRITHQLRLNEQSRQTIVEFVERCGQLGERLGCVLFQLPPNFSRDDSRLNLLLKSLPPGPRYAIEFRHASWLETEVFDKLANQNVACVSGDADNELSFQCVTADFIYVRLRRTSYSAADLDNWDAWFQDQIGQQRDVLAYVKHDESGVAPQEVLQRWATPPTSTARKQLIDNLANPKRKRATTKRKKA